MSFFSLRAGAALAALGGLAATASAQLPAPADPVPTPPKVIKWPGGYLWMDGPEVVVRSGYGYGTGRSANVITGTGNGFGNRIVVGGGAGGVTVVQNARNGIGNRLILDDDDLLIDLDELLGRKPACKKPAVPPAVIPPADPVAPMANPLPPAADPAPLGPPAADVPPSYKGKASPFWAKKMFSDRYDCNLYWCPTTKLWFRYGAEDDTYRPVPTQPAPPAEEK